MNDIKILVCCHRECKLPQNDIYLPIHVGSSISKKDLGIQRDDMIDGRACENISYANNIFCEMTGMYWAWKNIKNLYPEIKYIGLCHYRRYFNANITILSLLKNRLAIYALKVKEIGKIIIFKGAKVVS